MESVYPYSILFYNFFSNNVIVFGNGLNNLNFYEAAHSFLKLSNDSIHLNDLKYLSEIDLSRFWIFLTNSSTSMYGLNNKIKKCQLADKNTS